MNCFECATTTPAAKDRAAVAVCAHCGAAVCVEHATVTQHHLTLVEPLIMTVPVESPARRIYCPTCAAAVDAQAHPPDHAVHLHHRHH